MNQYAEKHYVKFLNFKNEADRLHDAGLFEQASLLYEKAQDEYYQYEEYMNDPPHLNEL